MAKLLSAIGIEMIEHLSKREAIRALAGSLSADDIVLHSYKTLSRQYVNKRRGVTTQTEGEGDSAILWPKKGLPVIEIKGGGTAYDATHACWSSWDRHDETRWINFTHQAKSK